jgi:ATP-dependent RNA helicase DDX46/PRP5
MTGASVTNKGEASFRISLDRELTTRLSGIYYESGKEPPADAPPKLHLLIESNEEFRVRLPFRRKSHLSE